MRHSFGEEDRLAPKGKTERANFDLIHLCRLYISLTSPCLDEALYLTHDFAVEVSHL